MVAVFLITVTHAPLVKAAPSEESIPFPELGYGDRSATTMFGALAYYFSVPQDVILREGTALNLVISHSPLLKENRSTLTVIVNDVSVYSTRLDESNARRGELEVALPVDSFGDAPDRADGYTVQLQFYMRLTDLVCEETTNPALWATVHEESSLTLAADPRPPADDLALLPYPFVVRGAREREPLTFSLDATPSTEEVAAALTTAAYLGCQTPARPLTMTARLGDAMGKGAVGKQIAIDAEPSGDTRSGGGSYGTASAALSLSPGAAGEALTLGGRAPLLAARALAMPTIRSQLKGEQVVVRDTLDTIPQPSDWAWRQDAATFAQLGAAERTVRGVGEQSTTFYFRRPAGWDLTPEEVFLDLHLTPSPLLLTEQSGVRVRINGYDVGAIDFEEQPADGFYRIDLPAELLDVTPDTRHATDLTIELRILQHLRQSECEPVYAENAWTTIHADSYLYLPHRARPLPDVSTFPYPFLRASEPQTVTVGLPMPPSDDELAAALTLAQQMGRRAFGPLPAFEVVPADSAEQPSGHVILIGAPERHPLIAAVEQEQLADERGLVQVPVTTDAVANLKAFPSPWAVGKFALIVSGEGEGLALAARALGRTLPSASILAVRADGSAAPLRQEVPPPRLPEPLKESRPALLPQPRPWQVTVGVLVVTMVAIIIAVAAFRLRSSEGA
jgi:hypothetical protein